MFSPTALILATAAQQHHVDGARVDGPVQHRRPRRRFTTVFTRTSTAAPRPVTTRRLTTLRPSSA